MRPAAAMACQRTTRAASTTCRPIGTRRATPTSPRASRTASRGARRGRRRQGSQSPTLRRTSRVRSRTARCHGGTAAPGSTRRRRAARSRTRRRSSRARARRRSCRECASLRTALLCRRSREWQRRNRMGHCRRAMPSPPPPLRSVTRRGGGLPSSTPRSTRTSLRTTPSPRPSRRRSARRRRWRRRQPHGRCRRLASPASSAPRRTARIR